MKECNDCKIVKSLDEFHDRLGSKDGKRNNCKECRKKSDRKYRDNNPHLAQKTTERVREYRASWSESKWEEYRAQGRKYAKNNPDVILNNTRKRQARKLEATPYWAETEWEQFVISEMYNLSYLLESTLGRKFNVDHIVPLQSDFVCGLHCCSNLQILTETSNKSKNNFHWPDMWETQ